MTLYKEVLIIKRKENIVKKLFAFDLDGTIVGRGSDKPKDESMLNMVHEITKKGHEAVIITGRSLSASMGAYNNFSFKGLISTHNGALITHPDNSLRLIELDMDKDIVFKILADQKLLDIKESIAIHYTDSILHQISEEKLLMKHPEYKGKCRKYFDGESLSENPISIIIKMKKEHNDNINKIINYLKNKFGLLVDITYWTSNGSTKIEIVNLKANKGAALKMIAKYYGVHMKNTIAFGDGGNDLQLLKEAGIGISMIDGVNELKEVADQITTLSCDKSGVWNHIIKNDLL